MIINGKSHPDLSQGTVSDILNQLKLCVTKVVVEVNGDIVPKGKYDEHWIDGSAKVEIVSFVGGG